MTAASPQPVLRGKSGVRIAMRLTPKSASDEIGAVMVAADGPVLAARVRVAPDKGAANAALLALVARWLGVPKSRVSLAAGGKSRRKTVAVAVAGDPAMLAARIEMLLEHER